MGESKSFLMRRRVSGVPSDDSKGQWMLCDGEGDLHSASTFTVIEAVKQYAMDLMDTNLLRKVTYGGDVVSNEAKYHKACMTKLFNKFKAHIAEKTKEEPISSVFHSITLAELVSHTDEAR